MPLENCARMTTRQWLSRQIQQVCLRGIYRRFPQLSHLPIRSSPFLLKSQHSCQISMPFSVRQLQEFVGMVNYYHRFIPVLTHTTAPLYSTLLGKPKSLLWEVQQEEAFIASQKSLASASTLCFPAPDTPPFSPQMPAMSQWALSSTRSSMVLHALLVYSAGNSMLLYV